MSPARNRSAILAFNADFAALADSPVAVTWRVCPSQSRSRVDARYRRAPIWRVAISPNVPIGIRGRPGIRTHPHGRQQRHGKAEPARARGERLFSCQGGAPGQARPIEPDRTPVHTISGNTPTCG